MGNYRKLQYLLYIRLETYTKNPHENLFIILFYFFLEEPTFKINWKDSKCSSYNATNNTITVEQGTPFLLKFEVTAWPIPTHVDLYKDGRKVAISQTNGTIFVGLDRVSIPRVDRQSYAGKYTVSARNSAGEGQTSFQLKVQGTSSLKPKYLCILITDTNFVCLKQLLVRIFS